MQDRETMLCGRVPLAAMERPRDSDQGDLEHPDVNDIQRSVKLRDHPAVTAKHKTSAMEFLTASRCPVAVTSAHLLRKECTMDPQTLPSSYFQQADTPARVTIRPLLLKPQRMNG